MTASLSLLVFLPLLFSVLAPLCLDGTLSWSWWWVCTPLFLFLLGLAVFLAFIAHGEFLWASVCVLFSLGFVGILCAKIENHFGSWYGTFTPLWISCAFAYVLDPQWPGFTHAVHWDKGDHVTGTLTLAVPRNFLLSLTIATVLLAIHLEQTPTPPFRVFFVFLPLLIYCGVTVLAGIALVEYRRLNHSGGAAGAALLACSAPVVVFLVLLTLRVVGATTMAFWAVFLPLNILGAVLMCAACGYSDED